MHRRHGLIFVVAIGLGLGACKRDAAREEDTPGAATATSATPQPEATVARSAAVEYLVATRCAREQACGNIGERKRFTDRDACVRETERQTKEGVDGSLCPRGIDKAALSRCLGALRGERCSDRSSPIRDLGGCAAGDLCVPDLPRR